MTLNISALPLVTCPGPVADRLGRRIIQVCADVARVSIHVRDGSDRLSGTLFSPAEASRLSASKELERVMNNPELRGDALLFAVDCYDLRNTASTLPGAALPQLRAAAEELLGYMEDAIGTHVYSLEDHDRIPANCGIFLSIERTREALGLPPSDIEVSPVWAYAATFANQHGERDDYQAEVLADTASEALDRGYADLLLLNPRATKIDGRADLVAGTPAASVEG